MKYIIIGGVATGASVGAHLRRLDEDAEIIILEKGKYVSFSNCGLPYRLSNTIDQTEKLILMTPQKLNAQYNLDVRVNNEVIAVSAQNKVVKVLDHETDSEYEIEYDKLVLAPGARAITPNIEGLDSIPHFNLKTVPDAANIVKHIENAKHMTVIGGGFIGVETAENLREYGLEVTLIEAQNQIVAAFDYEMSLLADLELEANGINVIKNDRVIKFEENKVLLASGKEVETDGVILSLGVVPDTNFLKESGIDLTERGYIETNDNYQTSNPDIYAGGDAILVKNQLTGKIGPLTLAGPANKQGRLIADAIAGKKIINNGYIGSGIIKIFDKTFASTGLNEKMLAQRDYDYEVVYAAPGNKVGLMPGATNLISKLIFDKDTGKILGAQAVAPEGADKRIDIIATAIKAQMSIYDLLDLELCYAPPFSTGKDVVNKLGYIATNLYEGDFKQVKYTDVYDLVKSGEQIIDVREAGEYANGHIKDVKNIPMSEIRNRLDEIDKDKTVYVHCQTGQRSYNIALMLAHKGYDVFNIAGSYLFTQQYEKAKQMEDSSRENILV